jgi:ATP-dependent RNA helicase DHX37/DHR1
VVIHFNKETPRGQGYIEAAMRKVVKIHQKLPPGGILVFLTGQDEIQWVCKSLCKRFPLRDSQAPASTVSQTHKSKLEKKRDHLYFADGSVAKEEAEDDQLAVSVDHSAHSAQGNIEEREQQQQQPQREDGEMAEEAEKKKDENAAEKKGEEEEAEKKAEEEAAEKKGEAEKLSDPSSPEERDQSETTAQRTDSMEVGEDDTEEHAEHEESASSADPLVRTVDGLYVLPLYSMLPTHQQMRVFGSPPPGMGWWW